MAGLAVAGTSPEGLYCGIIAAVVVDAGNCVGEDLEPLVAATSAPTPSVAVSGGDEEVGEQDSVGARIAAVVGVDVAASSLVKVVALEVEIPGVTSADVDG